MSGEYVIQDPDHKYAIEFIRRMRSKFGWRAVCFYTSPSGPSRNGPPELLSSEWGSANYHVRPGGLPSFIAHLAEHHDIRAVIPYKEEAVLNACEIATGLGLSWAQPEVVPLFRNKVAFKTHLAKVDPSIRLNQFNLVRSADEALKMIEESSVDRFVLKPVDGGGNYGIGIFDSPVEPETIRQFWLDQNKTEMIWEEFIGGTEYQCNGQVDGSGHIQILNLSRLIYQSVNGIENIRLRNEQVKYSDSKFTSIADYVTRIIKATGLRRNPFHIEVKFDDHGPCLIECAARIIGCDEATQISKMHHGNVDAFDLAAQGYATAEPYPESRGLIDWTKYDSKLFYSMWGVSTCWTRIYSWTGVAQVEAMPEFMGWTVKPFIGQKLRPTLHLSAFPYVVTLQGPTDEALRQAAHRIERTLKWNQAAPTPLTRVVMGMARMIRITKSVLTRLRTLRTPRLTSFG